MEAQKIVSDLMDDNTLIILGVLIIAFVCGADNADIPKYVAGGLLGYLKSSSTKGVPMKQD